MIEFLPSQKTNEQIFWSRKRIKNGTGRRKNESYLSDGLEDLPRKTDKQEEFRDMI